MPGKVARSPGDKARLIQAHRPPGLSVARACAALGLARSRFYALVGRPPKERPLDARVEETCLRFEAYGYRRVAAQLRREGLAVGRKAVRASMRRLGLLARTKPRRKRTTVPVPVPVDAANLLAAEPATAPRRVLAVDASGIPLGEGRGLYLAAVLDLFTRQALGLSLGTRLDTRLTLAALAKALARGMPEAGWIHHSDRGSTDASEEYRRCVAAVGGRSSFTKPGSPQQNGAMESLFKTLKAEETSRNEYASPAEADAQARGAVRGLLQQREDSTQASATRPPISTNAPTRYDPSRLHPRSVQKAGRTPDPIEWGRGAGERDWRAAHIPSGSMIVIIARHAPTGAGKRKEMPFRDRCSLCAVASGMENDVRRPS